MQRGQKCACHLYMRGQEIEPECNALCPGLPPRLRTVLGGGPVAPQGGGGGSFDTVECIVFISVRLLVFAT
eukprot:5996898-Karenia_brevis.AAC.1